jgi:hypothetical protein
MKRLSETDLAWQSIQDEERLRRVCDAKNRAIANGTYRLSRFYRDTLRAGTVTAPRGIAALTVYTRD